MFLLSRVPINENYKKYFIFILKYHLIYLLHIAMCAELHAKVVKNLLYNR